MLMSQIMIKAEEIASILNKALTMCKVALISEAASMNCFSEAVSIRLFQ